MSKTSRLARRFAALLLVIGATGAGLAVAQPAGAATPPDSVTWLQRDRSVDLVSSSIACRNITLATTTSVTVPFNSTRSIPQAWFTCSLNGTTIRGDLYTNASYNANRWASATYEMWIKIVRGTSVTNCGSTVWVRSDLDGYVGTPFSGFWNQLYVQSTHGDTRVRRNVDCPGFGTVGAYFEFVEGQSAS